MDATATQPGKKNKTPRHSPIAKGLLIAGICFVASFFGAWVFMQTGLVRLQSHQVSVESRRELVLQEGEVVAETAKEVSPSVVSIVTQAASRRSIFDNASNVAGGSGTGIIISKDGYIITNKHVVPEGTAAVKIVLADGTTHDKVTIVGRDPLNDIAFLKVNDVNDLQPAKLSYDKVITGQKVVAIGNALGQYQNSVTAGIISGMGRPVTAENDSNGETEQLQDLYQTDAAINPGNSGGPLVNLKGEVIAINTAVVDDAQGIGFAIPIKAAKGLIKGVLANAKIERSYLGVRQLTITPEIARRYNLSVQRGAYVKSQEGASIVADGPAQKAGIKEGDIITQINGEKIDETGGLSLLIAQYTPNETINLTILRDGKQIELTAKLGTYQPS